MVRYKKGGLTLLCFWPRPSVRAAMAPVGMIQCQLITHSIERIFAMRNVFHLVFLALGLASETASAAGGREISYFCGVHGRPGATLNLVLSVDGDQIAAAIHTRSGNHDGRYLYSRAKHLDLDERDGFVNGGWEVVRVAVKPSDTPKELSRLLGKGARGFDMQKQVSYSSSGLGYSMWMPYPLPSSNGLHVARLYIPIALFDDTESELIGLQVGRKLDDYSKALDGPEFVTGLCKRTETRDL